MTECAKNCGIGDEAYLIYDQDSPGRIKEATCISPKKGFWGILLHGRYDTRVTRIFEAPTLGPGQPKESLCRSTTCIYSSFYQGR